LESKFGNIGESALEAEEMRMSLKKER